MSRQPPGVVDKSFVDAGRLGLSGEQDLVLVERATGLGPAVTPGV
jgi:hypothetical protein